MTTITLDDAHQLCVELKIESIPETRSRAVRALSLVDTVRLDDETGMVKVYRVQSQSDKGKQYSVLSAPIATGYSTVCFCPDFMEKGNLCKHGIAVRMFRKREDEGIARREQQQRDAEFYFWWRVDEQNYKETYLQSLCSLSAPACATADRCNAQVDGREVAI
jgi:hypothetical protein